MRTEYSGAATGGGIRLVTCALLLALGCGRTLPLPLGADQLGGAAGSFRTRDREGGVAGVGFPDGGTRDARVGTGGTGGRGPSVDGGDGCTARETEVCVCSDGSAKGIHSACVDPVRGRGPFGPCMGCPVPDSCDGLSTGSLPRGCGRALCQCAPGAARACDTGCWDLLACVVQQCGASGMDSQCIVSFCSDFLQGASVSQAMAFGGCMGALPDKCIGRRPNEFCGNGVRDEGEPCDGSDFGGSTCASFGLPGAGSLRCTASCGLDTSGCAVGVCGNGVIEQTEACDGAALGGVDCKDLGFVGGMLACSGCAYDTRACIRCGNGRVESGEVCEGSDVMGLSCLDLGYTGGKLACSACQYDTGACARCGNGVIEAGERCDGAMLAGQSCNTLGLGDGMLACDPNVCLFDARGCSAGGSPVCGNGVAERGEACDLKDLAGLDCVQLGFGGGVLRCNQQTCRFDTSACTRMTPPTDCSACGREHCAASIDACTSQPQCHGGLDCLANMCGPEAQLDCATACFGNTQPALAALSMFACIVNQCGAQCVGDF